jgi:hypothetical protein
MFAVSRSTGSARAAPNARASFAFMAPPLATAMPMAIRHAISRAVIPMMSAPPRTIVRIPIGRVKKNVAISTSAMTRPSASDITKRITNIVAGVSAANATTL